MSANYETDPDLVAIRQRAEELLADPRKLARWGRRWERKYGPRRRWWRCGR